MPPGAVGCGKGGSKCRPMWEMQRQEEGRKGMEPSAAEGEPRRAAGPLLRWALRLPGSMGSPAWRRQRSSRAANLSKEGRWFVGTAEMSEVSLVKRQERGKWRCMMVSDLSMGYVCFSHPARGFSQYPSTCSSGPFPIITSSWLQLCSPLTPCPLWGTPRALWVRVNMLAFLQTAPVSGSQVVVQVAFLVLASNALFRYCEKACHCYRCRPHQDTGSSVLGPHTALEKVHYGISQDDTSIGTSIDISGD